MNETQVDAELRRDLQSAPAQVVIYLEGKTDPPVFFALLGVAPPRDDIHRGVLVRGLKDTTSGGDAVRARVDLAGRSGYAGDKHLVAGYDPEARFAAEVAHTEATIRGSLDEGHALVNGKWLVDVFAPRALGANRWNKHRCRSEWIAHATASGGLGVVRNLWERITGRPP